MLGISMTKSIYALLVVVFNNKSAGGFIISSPIRHASVSIHTSSYLEARPKSGSVVDSYQTVSVNCNSCRSRLFRYKKKNGTKSNLIVRIWKMVMISMTAKNNFDIISNVLFVFVNHPFPEMLRRKNSL